MIDYKYKDYFLQSSIEKQITISWSGGELTNTDLYTEDMKLTESLNSGTQLDFGSCESASLEFTSSNIDVDLTGEEITLTITMYIDGEAVDEPLVVGKYIVEEDTLNGERTERKIKAYDAMYTIINADVIEWYEDLDFPMTLKEFRDDFFDYMGVEQEETTLVNDDMNITQTVLGSTMSGQDVVHAICEINGCFGTIRQGVFTYVFLPYASETTATAIDRDYYSSCEFSDYVIQPITGLKIIGNYEEDEESEESSEYYVIVSQGTNMYVVTENFLLYDKTDTEIIEYGERMFDIISAVGNIRPAKVTAIGNPCNELGDAISVDVSNRYSTIYTCILERTLSGIQALEDVYQAEGEEYYTYDSNSTSDSLKRLWGQTQTLLSSVEEKGIIVVTGTNEKDLTINSTDVEILELEVVSQADAIPIFIGTFPINMSLDGEVTFTTYIDKVEHISITGQAPRGNNFLTFTDNFTISKGETKTFNVYMHTGYYESDIRQLASAVYGTDIDTTIPTATIADNATIAEIFLQGGTASDIWNGKITVADVYKGIEYTSPYTPPTNITATLTTNVIDTDTSEFSEVVATVSYTSSYTVTTTGINEAITFERGYTGLWGAWITEAWQAASGWTWKDMGDSSSYIVDVLGNEESEEE